MQEVWVTSDELDRHLKQVDDDRKVKVSNKGRVLLQSGRVARDRCGVVIINKKRYSVRRLVYMGLTNKSCASKAIIDDGNLRAISLWESIH